jgi:signal transduction histidine kinase
VAKGLVEAMGGRIWIDEGGGEAAGTTFRLSLTLPLADAPAVSAAGAATP